MNRSWKRKTNETCVEVSLDPEGSGRSEVSTGIEFFDEILRNLANASGFDLFLRAKGDLDTGDHHIVEDVGITLGIVLAQTFKRGMGSSIVPSGHSLGLAAIRFGETFFTGHFRLQAISIGGMSLENFEHFMRALASNGRFTLYLQAEGNDDKYNIEAMSLALGRALKLAYLEGKEKS